MFHIFSDVCPSSFSAVTVVHGEGMISKQKNKKRQVDKKVDMKTMMKIKILFYIHLYKRSGAQEKTRTSTA